jgi:hypothetical protein
MVRNSFGKRNFIQPMGRPKHALKCLGFLPFRFEGGRIFFHFSLVPFKFPWVLVFEEEAPQSF